MLTLLLIWFLVVAAQCPVPPIPPFPTPPPATPTIVPTVTPVPTMTSTPMPQPSPTPASGIPDIKDITFLDDGKVGNWPQTSTITKVETSPQRICIYHTKQNSWPMVKTAMSNPWFVAKIGGRWLAATYEFNGPNQACKDVVVGILGEYTQYRETKAWHPQIGELYGLFVSTVARLGVPHGQPPQRSDIVWRTW